jgi:hypothetical protein
MRQPIYSRERVLGPVVVEAGCASGPVGKDMEKKCTRTGFLAPDRSARRESLHRVL